MWPSWENAVAFDVSKLGLALGSLHKAKHMWGHQNLLGAREGEERQNSRTLKSGPSGVKSVVSTASETSLPLGDLKIFFYGGMMEVHASGKNAFFWNSYKVPFLGLHVRLPAGTGRFQLFEDWKLMWKPFHLYSRWWLNSSFWDHLGVWTLQIVGQTTGLNWYRFSAVASSMPAKVRWTGHNDITMTMIDNQSCHSLFWIPQGVHQSQLGPIICVLAHIFVEISYIYQHDYPIEYRILFFFSLKDAKKRGRGGRSEGAKLRRQNAPWWSHATLMETHSITTREYCIYDINIMILCSVC